jgi:hypothetical protein
MSRGAGGGTISFLTPMATLGFVEAFRKFGARPANPMWAVSAIADDGALVVSFWAHHCRTGGNGVLVCSDRLSRWSGNELGNSLLLEHLGRAMAENLPVRMVVATTTDIQAVESGHDGSKVRKTFHVREDLVGRVASFDGDNYVVEFRRRPSVHRS